MGRSCVIKKVLCVDDNEEHLEILKLFFEINGFETEICSTHQECFEYLQKQDFSAIILDGWMAEKDGFEICRLIRTINVSIPIIFYTADATAQSRKNGLESGANAYLIKPDDIDKVVSTVADLIEKNNY